jgi:cell division protein FtsW
MPTSIDLEPMPMTPAATMAVKWLRAQLWILIAMLCGFGLVMVASTTATMGKDGAITYAFIVKQAGAMVLGLGLAAVVSTIGAQRWRRPEFVAGAYGLTVFALLMVLAVGRSINGARRWIDLGPINLQPAELAKFALVVAAAWHFSRSAERVRSTFHGVLLPLGGFAVVAGLIYLTKDLGSVLVLATGLTAMLVYAGAPWLYFTTLSLLAAPAGLYFTVFSEAYRQDRILAFLDPEHYDGPAAYHLRQSYMAIASGGLFGVGLGQSSSTLTFLPERHTDFIYAVVCCEFGMAGGLLLAFVYLALVGTGLAIAAHARDLHHRLVAVGVTIAIGLQAFWNMLVVTGGVPTKGLTLPFISYGGSSVLVCLGLVGLLDAVARSTIRAGVAATATAARAPLPAAPAATATRIGGTVTSSKALRWM